MRPVVVDVLLGAGGVASGTAGWCSGRCSEYGTSRGWWCPRKELPHGRLSDAQEGDLLTCFAVCFGRS